MELNNKNHLRGEFSIGKNRVLKIDTSTHEGMEELFGILKPFIKYQSSIMTFPGYDPKDVEQEISRMVWEVLPKYDATRKANLLTFLQGHVKKRIINMCKFHAEKRRNASFIVNGLIKIRCNSCRMFFQGNTHAKAYTCPTCRKSAAKTDANWNFYNIPIVAQSYIEAYDGEGMLLTPEINSDNAHFAAVGRGFDEERLLFNTELQHMTKNLTDSDRSIIKMIYQGYTKNEVMRDLKVTDHTIKRALNKLGIDLGLIPENVDAK